MRAVLVFFALVCSTSGQNQAKVRVSTSYAEIEGIFSVSEEGRQFYSFRGIPYAKPPLGDLRFKKPEPIDDKLIHKIIDATRDGPICSQKDWFSYWYQGEEDCLVLNVYTPQLPVNGHTHPKKAVLVFIHGGSFVFGSGHSELYGPDKLMDHDVILVTINYRLGALGFLTTNDDEAPGNYGMWDQIEALKWVRNHIHRFGGDRDRITIMGESAGAYAVATLLAAPPAAGLFHGVIAHSGVGLCNNNRDDDTVVSSERIARLAGCPTQNSTDMVKCLRSLPGSEFARLMHDKRDADEVPRTKRFSFWPRPEQSNVKHTVKFLPEKPEYFIRNGKFPKIPYLTGINRDEGEFMTLYSGIDIDPENIRQNLPTVMRQALPHLTDDNIAQLAKLYFHGLNEMKSEDITRNWIKVLTDGIHGSCTKRAVEFLSDNGATAYLYNFDHKGKESLVGKMFEGKVKGIPHYDEISYLFSVPAFGIPKFTGEDKEIQDRMLKMWAKFIKTGKPSSVWTPVSKGSTHYYRFSTDSMDNSNPFVDNSEFWSSLYVEKNEDKREL